MLNPNICLDLALRCFEPNRPSDVACGVDLYLVQIYLIENGEGGLNNAHHFCPVVPHFTRKIENIIVRSYALWRIESGSDGR
jgi:hypothetical protein